MNFVNNFFTIFYKNLKKCFLEEQAGVYFSDQSYGRQRFKSLSTVGYDNKQGCSLYIGAIYVA